jgi:hypothetical protein
METVREKWTDERLDDLNGKVDDLGRRMDLRFDSVDRRFERIDARLDSMGKVMIQGYIAMGTCFIALASLIVAQG